MSRRPSSRMASAWSVGDRVHSRTHPTAPSGTVTEVQAGMGAFEGLQIIGYQRDDGEEHIALGGELEPEPVPQRGA